ncbi:MAG TPA: alpha/beta hydrolase, partial [Allocoleopsis sp.]
MASNDKNREERLIDNKRRIFKSTNILDVVIKHQQIKLPFRRINFSPRFPHLSCWQSLVLGSITTLLTMLPVRAAEQIEFSYNQLEFYLSVDSLVTYAQTGKIDSELGFYFQFLNEEEQAQFRDALKFSRPISSWEVSQILYTPMGEAALRNLGTLIQTESRQNGFYGMRSAMIQAAAEPEGLSLLGFLRHFPTDS